jgi:conjugative relaxase-like TrwC/TraI family protein
MTDCCHLADQTAATKVTGHSSREKPNGTNGENGENGENASDSITAGERVRPQTYGVAVLSIGKLGPGGETYYEQNVARGADDYYAGRGESPGRWLGRGAEALGLEGVVPDGALTALVAGNHPVTGERLRSRPVTKVAVLDLTFSAPKSLSVIHALGDERTAAVLASCHDEATDAAVGYLQDVAMYVRRGHGGAEFQRADVIVGAFRHRLSRAKDPQMHTHCVIPNMARGEDGDWSALHHPTLFRTARTAGFLYQTHLRELVNERLGLEWGPVRNGVSELVDVPADVRGEFSRRKAELAEALAELQAAGKMQGVGIDGRDTFRVDGLRTVTRERKGEAVDLHAWRANVAARAAEHGLTRGDVNTLLTRAAGSARDVSGVPSDLAGRLAGPHGLTEKSNTFAEADVLREFAAAAAQGASVARVRQDAREFLARADVIELAGGRWTTQDLVDAERARESAQLGRADTRTAVMSGKAVRDGTRGLGLNDGQRWVVEAIAKSGNGVDLVQAQAGTGKTTTMSAVRRVAELDGRRVIGCAPTGRAAGELQKLGGIESHTLDSLVRKLDRGDLEVGRRDVLVLDEAGMTGTRLAARLERHAADAGAKLIEIGDRRQLQSVLAGGELTGAHKALGGLELREVVRQRGLEERRILGRLHAGDVKAYVEHQDAAGRVHWSAEVEQAVSEYMRHARELGFDQVAFICPTNAMVTAANDLVREQLGRTRPLEPGDRVLCRMNDRAVQVVNGDRATVTRVHGAGVDVQLDSGVKRSIPRSYIDAGFVQHGYAQTVHTAQGATVDRCVIAARPAEMYAELAYVAASRARDTTDLYVIDSRRVDERAEIGPVSHEVDRDQRDELLRAMSESRAEELAMDQLPVREPAGLGLER